MTPSLADLLQTVTAAQGVVESATALVKGLAVLFASHPEPGVLADEIFAAAGPLANAVVAGRPPEPVVPVEPTVLPATPTAGKTGRGRKRHGVE